MNPFNIHETDLGSLLSGVPTGETPFIRFSGVKRVSYGGQIFSFVEHVYHIGVNSIYLLSEKDCFINRNAGAKRNE